MIIKEIRSLLIYVIYKKNVLKCRNDVADLYSTSYRVDRRPVSVCELISSRACHFSNDVRALPCCREFVFTLLDLAKDQIPGGESAATYIVIVIAT